MRSVSATIFLKNSSSFHDLFWYQTIFNKFMHMAGITVLENDCNNKSSTSKFDGLRLSFRTKDD